MAEPDIILQAKVQVDTSALIREAQRAAEAFSKPLGRISSDANQFRQAIDASTARVVAFATSTSAILAVNLAFKKLIDSTTEVERALTDINVLFKLGRTDLVRFSNDLFRVANNTGTSFQDAAKAATEFSRQGLGVDETLKRLNAALTLTRLSGLDLATSVTSLTSIINAFTKEALDATTIVDKLANVDAAYAISSADLAEALKRVGSSATDANVSLSETVALITSAQQTTARGGAIIGQSLKTIFTRLQRPQVLDDLEGVGVKTRDLQGKTLPLISVLKNLASSYDTLSSGQKSFITETIGSVYQINILKAILSDLGSGVSVYDEALKKSNSTSGESQRRIQELNQTISSQLIRTFNNLTKAASGIGNLVIQPTIKGGLTSINNLLEQTSEVFNVANKTNGGTLFQGLAKGIGNILQGPGLQIAVFGIFKIFQQLTQYVLGAARDISGLNIGIKERELLEKDILARLIGQKGVLQELKSGNLGLAEAAQKYLQIVTDANLEIKEIYGYTKAIAGNLASNPARPKLSIPNLSPRTAIKEALTRENKATGGNAILSQSPLLISNGNPLGLAAIDKRTQKNANEAIVQHLMLGQPLFEVKKSGTTGVPNLAVDPLNTILLSTILGSAQGSDFGNFKKGISAFTESISSTFTVLSSAAKKESEWIATRQKSIQTERDFLSSANKAKEALIKGNPQTFASPNGEKIPVSDTGDFNRLIQPHVSRVEASVREFEERSQTQNRKIRNFGFGAAIGGALVGGEASQFLGHSNPDLGAATDEFVGGLVNAGQVLTVFQGTAGKAAASFLLVNGTINAIDVFGKRLESQKRSFEIQESNAQKFAAGIDGAISSISNLNSLYLDSSVSLEALNREQQKLTDSLATLASSGPEGLRLTSRVEGNSDSNSKIQLLGFAKELETRKLSETAGLLQVSELGASRTVFGRLSGLSGGIFGAGNDTEKIKALSVLKGNAGNILTSLNDEQRAALIGSVGNFGAFKNQLGNNEIAKTAINHIREVGGTENDVNLLVNAVRDLVNHVAASENQNVRNVRAGAIGRNNSAQVNVDLATRNAEGFKRLFFNSGSLLAENNLDIQKSGIRGTLNQASIQEAKRRAEAGALGFLSGDKTVAANDLSIELGKIEAERQSRLGNLKNQTFRSIIGASTQNVDVLGKANSREEKNPINNPNPPSLGGEFTEAIFKALNTGLSSVSKENSNQFFNSQGQFDFKSFEDKIVQSSGAGNQATADQVRRVIESTRGSIDILKEIKELNNQSVEINQDQLTQQQIAVTKFNAMIKELDVKKQANFEGGTRLLTDRDSRRQLEREIVSGRRLAATGNTLEARGRGAATLLKAIREGGINPLSVAKEENGRFIPNSFSKFDQEIAQLLNLERNALKEQQEKFGQRVEGIIGRGQFTTAVRQNFISPVIAQRNGLTNLAGNAVSATERPEGANLINSALKESTTSFNTINNELTIADSKLRNFGISLDDIAAEVKKAFDELGTAKKEQEKTQKSASDDIEKALKNALVSTVPDIEKAIVSSSNKAKYAQTGLQLAGGAGILLGLRSLTTKGRTENAELFKSISSKVDSGGVFLGSQGKKIRDVVSQGLTGQNSFYGKRRADELAKRTPNGPIDRSSSNFNPRFAQKQNLNAYSAERVYNLFGGKSVKLSGPDLPVIPFPQGKALFESLQKTSVPSPGTSNFIGPTLGASPYPNQYPNLFDKRGVDFQTGNVPLRGEIPFGKYTTSSPQTGGLSSYNTSSFPFKSFRFGNNNKISSSLGNTTHAFPEYNLNGANLSFGGYPEAFPASQHDLKGLQDSLQKNQVGGGINTRFGRKGSAGFISANLLRRGGALLGATAAGIGGSIGGALIGNRLLGDQYGIGASIGGAIGGSLATAGIAKAAPALGSVLAPFAAPAAAVALGTALVVGPSAYKTRKEFSGIETGEQQAYSNAELLVKKQLSRGDSIDKIKSTLDAQIATSKNNLSNFNGIGPITSFLTGSDKQKNAVEQEIAALEALKASLDEIKQQKDDEKNQQNNFKELIAAISNANSSSNIKVEISLKDVDKLPDIFNEKIIKPLEEQLKNLQSRVSNTENKAGINPTPASV